METALIKHGIKSKDLPTALQSTQARHCAERDINNVLVQSVYKAAQYCGQTISDEDAAFIFSNIQDVIRTKHGNIRLDEIPIAFERGVLGEFGEFYGINVATLSKFITAHMESESRVSAAKALLAPKDEHKIPSPEELRAMENEIIINAYSTFCSTGSFADAGNHIYNKLDERGMIPFTVEVKLAIMEKAKKAVEARNNPSTATSIDDRRKKAQFIESLAKGLKSAESAIIREAKQIALNEYFSGLREMETDIKLLLEEQSDD